MAAAAPILTSFNAGELSKDLSGRVDIAKYASGAARMENFLPLVQGPVQRRAGFRYVKPTKGSGKVWLIKFEFSQSQAFVLEFGDLYVRFFTQHGQLESSPGVPYEIVSPYALADLTNTDGTCALNVEQSGDVLYIANQYGTYKPQKLTRFANTNWTFSDYAPNQGPFDDMNIGSTTIYSSAASGSVTLTASAALFAATDVGRLVRLEVQTYNVHPWETALAYVTGNLVRYDGKTYKALNTATSGTFPPTHEHDSAYDGQTGVQWQYQDAGYGVARITAYTDSTHVTATVINDPPNGLNVMPDGVVGSGNATKRWSLGAWSATTGYPRTVKFYKSRLFWCTRQGVYASVPDDYENHAPDFFNEIRTDNAINRTLQAQDVNDILWLEASKVLLIGTGGGEFVAGPLTATEPIGPANFGIDKQSKKRVRAVQPIIVGTSLIFVQRAGRKLQTIDYQVTSDSYVSTDLAVLSNRITASGIIGMVYQGEPYSIIWCHLANGKLLGFTYDKEQEVTGWHRHPVGGNGTVESICVIPAPDGTREELWAVVNRTINGATVRYVEYLEKPFESADDDGTGGDEQSSCFYVDSGLTYTGSATKHITGLSHLEGATVQVLGDGAVQPDCVVSGGAIDIARAASVIQVGLACSARLVTNRLEAGSQNGTSQGKIKRSERGTMRVIDTIGGAVGLYGGKIDNLSRRKPSTPMGQAPDVYTGDVDLDFPGDYEKDLKIEVRQDQPLPMTIAAIMPQVSTYG